MMTSTIARIAHAGRGEPGSPSKPLSIGDFDLRGSQAVRHEPHKLATRRFQLPPPATICLGRMVSVLSHGSTLAKFLAQAFLSPHKSAPMRVREWRSEDPCRQGRVWGDSFLPACCREAAGAFDVRRKRLTRRGGRTVFQQAGVSCGWRVSAKGKSARTYGVPPC